MKYLLSLSLLLLVSPASFSQTDTTYLFFDKSWQECKKDTAYYKGIVYKHDNLWNRKDVWVKNNLPQMEATFLDKDCKTYQGIAKWYNENGTLKSTALYENGEKKTADFFYESGKKKGHISYSVKGEEQKGWDENGAEIRGYIAEKEAIFPGGTKGWVSYLEQNLNADVAAKSRAKAGIYTVAVQFIVDKEGKISNVRATEIPASCSRCAKEAVRVIKNGPDWIPAVQDNRKVIYQAIQKISFQVVEEEVRKG